MIGFRLKSKWIEAEKLEPTDEVVAYLYNQSNEHWTSLGENFPCQTNKTGNGFSCANLKREHSIVVSIERCVAIVDSASMEWSFNLMTNGGGLLFNADEKQEAAIYIESNRINGSDVYKVTFIVHLLIKIFFILDLSLRWNMLKMDGFSSEQYQQWSLLTILSSQVLFN